MRPGRFTAFAVVAALAVAIGVASAAGESRPSVTFRPATIGLFRRTSVTVRGLSATSVEVHLKGATDPAGLAYEWTPYRWRRLRPVGGAWRGALSAPALLGVYQLQLRVDGRRRALQSPSWLLRVFSAHTLSRPSFSTPAGVVGSVVAHLPGDDVVVAVRRLRPAAFDHRDPRLTRIFAVAYAPRGDTKPSARLGMFVTTARSGFRGPWRLLDTSVEPYG
jgi:hypothetical protein